MQPKISSFFRPPRASDLGLSEITRPQISVTYSRRRTVPDQPIDDTSGAEVVVGEEPVKMPVTNQKPSVGSRSLNKKRSYAQLHLDLGQSDFLLHSCSICGLKYAPGEVDDEKLHKSFHKNYSLGLPFKGWNNERVIQTPLTECRIVVVLDSDPLSHKSKVQEILKIMETDLGDSGIYHKLCKVYLFISAQRVAGCLVAEPLQVAHKILSSCVNEKLITEATKGKRRPMTLQFGSICFQRDVVRRASSVDVNDAVNGNCSGAILCENETVPVACGIRAIWVTPSNRRKHIATQLLDAVRKDFSSDLVLEKNQLAFAQPTSDGKALGARYTGITTFLVY
uniref:Uncharacterized protein n=1 Tax=Kalanchoe fedtschenkoi TaxID=63787 RepID=A0A7N0TZK0_KALFE